MNQAYSLDALIDVYESTHRILTPPPSSKPIDRYFDILAQALPGYEPRRAQIELTHLVADGLATGQHVIAEAGTGCGKSFAYLIPAIDYAVHEHARVIVSTGTIALQEQLMQKDIPFLQTHLGLSFKAALAKGKSNYLCPMRLQEEAQQLALQSNPTLDAIADWYKNTETGDKSELPIEASEEWGRVCVDDNCLTVSKCPFASKCFLPRAKQQLEEADLIVCNHALYFVDMQVRSRSGGRAQLLPDADAVIFDEAHHIEDAARRALGIEISSLRLARILKRAEKVGSFDPADGAMAEECNRYLFEVLRAGAGNETAFRVAYSEKLQQAADALTEAVKRVRKVLGADDDDELDGIEDEYDPHEDSGKAKVKNVGRQLGTLCQDLGQVLDTQQSEEHWNVVWAEVHRAYGTRPERTTLHVTPVAVAGLLREALFEDRTVVMTSATISTDHGFEYLKRSVGCQAALELQVDSPFDYFTQGLIYVPNDLPDPREPEFYDQAARRIEEILVKTNGRAFVLFTSYSGMNRVYDAIAPRLRWTVLKQGDAPRSLLIERFKEDTHSVLFATSSFWEGIDVQGESLSCVIIDKLPFAVPNDPVYKAKEDDLKRRGRNAFAELAVPDAVIRLKQGVGRLIRSKSDRGLVAILDKRLRTQPYGLRFLDALPRFRRITSLENVEAFLEGRN